MQMIVLGFLFIVIRKTVLTGEVIRLINGPNPLQGELQVLQDGIWSYVCYDNWTVQNTNVMCRMLRNKAYDGRYGTSGGYRACMYNITCSGDEESIDECMNGVVYKSCLLHESVSVRCGEYKMIPSTPGIPGIRVRLVDGNKQNEGNVEVGLNGTWRRVANTNNSWGNKEADVICRMVGYSTDNAIGFHTPTLTQVQCTGIESSIDLCSREMGNSCASTYLVYLYCSCISSNCNENSFRYCDVALGTCETACSPGRYISGSDCYICGAGTYQPATDQHICFYCPFGTYQNLFGQSSCKACPVGKYINSIVGATTCTSCPPGTYQDQIGQISCKQCDAGSYQNMAEQTSCITCETGTYQNSIGKTTCIPCEGGSTTIRPGSITQSECYKRQVNDLCQQTVLGRLLTAAMFLAAKYCFVIIYHKIIS
ncbi:hypothetical protein CHS0354_021353 [Potamilus streckersoni]|uniref:SRCR domain-containing protein n=1 Tax=Potamilus streckersoni TaxID=2493646 RepID=A0AAE0VNF4_9BIVA|nr:hypothetical protein CHS0354_021353 [Potamilus streckersoni]